MRRHMILFISALAAFAIVGGSASAVTRPIGFVTSKRLEQICGQNGGTFMSTGSGLYTCTKECTSGSGKKDGCTVVCDSYTKKCEGTTPDRTAGGTVQQILRGGTYSDRRNPTKMIDNAGTFAKQPTPPSRLIDNAGTFQSRPPATVGVPTTSVPSLAMPGGSSQPTLNMKKR